MVNQIKRVMKELSIEQKAKRYDEAIKKAESLYKAAEPMSGCNVIIETLFPELKESEDEKHRKWILEYLYDGLRKSDEQFKGQFKCAIAWLEKQGEPQGKSALEAAKEEKVDNQNCAKPNDKVEPKFKVGDKIVSTISGIPYCITEVCNGHYATDTGCIIMFCSQDNFKIYKQKPAWSEEDERMLESVIWHLRNSVNNGDVYHSADELEDWLKSLCHQSKQE